MESEDEGHLHHVLLEQLQKIIITGSCNKFQHVSLLAFLFNLYGLVSNKFEE
jgi:hypothetical protein